MITINKLEKVSNDSRYEAIYVLQFDTLELPGTWKEGQNQIVVFYQNNKFKNINRWNFPLDFYGTRDYFRIMRWIDEALTQLDNQKQHQYETAVA
jgi:hypothetical protein